MVITKYREFFREVALLNRATNRKEYLEGSFTLNAELEEDPVIYQRYQDIITKERLKLKRA